MTRRELVKKAWVAPTITAIASSAIPRSAVAGYGSKPPPPPPPEPQRTGCNYRWWGTCWRNPLRNIW